MYYKNNPVLCTYKLYRQEIIIYDIDKTLQQIKIYTFHSKNTCFNKYL